MSTFDDGYEGVTVAGVAVIAADTQKVLLAQREYDPTDAPEVAETWEFPGGHLNPGEDAQAGAFREFNEEIGFNLPEGEVVDGWRSEDGHYQCFVYVVDHEFEAGTYTPNDEVQRADWFDRSQCEDGNHNLRPEVQSGTDWDLLFGSVSRNEDEMDEAAQYASIPVMPIPVHGVVAPEDTPTGDGRGFNAGSMTRRPLRLPFRDTATDIGAHGGAFVVGSVDRLMRADGLVQWEGLLMPSAQTEAIVEKMEFFGGRYGVSVDGDQGSVDKQRTADEQVLWFDQIRSAGLTAVDIPAFHQAFVGFGLHPTMPAEDTDAVLAASGIDQCDIIGGRPLTFGRGAGWVTDPKATKNIHDYWTKKGEEGYAKVGWGTPGDFTRAKNMIGAKIAQHSPEKMKYLNQIIAQWHFDALGYWPGDLGKPGNAPDTAENRKRAAQHAAAEHGIVFAEGAEDVVDREEVPEPGTVWEAVLTSSAGKKVRPPASYFDRHPDTGATFVDEPDENGLRRTYGYAAEWGVCHIGYSGRCVEPPRPDDGSFPDFHLGYTRLDDGEIMSTGVLTYMVDHRDAQDILTETAEQQHFDNVANAWAAVRLGIDDRGIWFSGVVLPGVPEADVTLIEATGQVSGEWKYGSLRALQSVNTPGFGVLRSSATFDDEGNVTALVAVTTGKDMVLVASANGVEESECSARTRMHAIRDAYALVRMAEIKTKAGF